jgi:GT2 family glycosyltransferase
VSSTPETVIVIPNWNGAHHLPECLDSLARQTLQATEVLVVDNGSSDDSVDLVRDRYPWVRVIQHPDNRGFSAAVNSGIRATGGEFVALLNNDTRAEPDWLERLVGAMQRWPEASFAASKMLRYDPPHAIDSAGDRFNLLAGAGANLGAGQSRDTHSEFGWTFGACAGAAIYRRALFDDIGLFDEDFFLVFEDVDLDLRAQVAGHRCLYVPNAIVYHKRGASTDNASLEIRSRTWRNAIWVAGKNLPPVLLTGWLIAFALRLLRLALLAGLTGLWRRIRRRPPDTASGESSSGRASGVRRGALMSHYLPALRQAFSALPAKRRETRRLRRRGSLALLPVLIRATRPIS